MKTLTKTLTLWTTFLLSCSMLISSASASGLMTAKGSKTELQIRDHRVQVSIEDGYAITTIENSFYNPSTTDLEAVYEFPVPENGTVAEFTLWIDDKPIIGEVVEKERAKQIYQQQRDSGRDVGITEKKEFYRFESRVSPVRAQALTKTRLVYMQAADVEGGIGRYVYPLQEGGTDENKLEFWSTDESVQGQFSFDLQLRSGFPVDALRTPAHPHAQISQSDAQNWSLTLNKNGTSSPATGSAVPEQSDVVRTAAFADLPQTQESIASTSSSLNQDIVVYWRLRPDLPGSIELVTHREPGERRGTFMLTLTPGIDLQPISEGRDWVFVLDRSGSMSGKYQSLMDATAQALKQLGTQDRFKIVLFSNRVEHLTSDWVTADQISIQKVNAALAQSQPDGGTDMYAGIDAAVRGLDSDRTSSIILVTDGVANLGKTEKKDFIDLLAKQDVRLFTAIMGNGANRPLLDSMVETSNGFATSVSNSDDIMGVLISATEKVKYQALHDVDLSIKGLRTTDLVPDQPTTLYRGQQMTLFGHYFGDEQAEVILSAKISGEKKEYRSQFSFPKESTDNPEIERLWAYAQIQELKGKADYLGAALDDYRSAIVDTATEYGLVTDFTSMLVMTDEQFEQNGIERTNRDRRNKENKAATKRAASGAKSNRVDQNQPAFSGNQANYSNSGSGAMGPFSILLLLPLIVLWIRQRLITQNRSI